MAPPTPDGAGPGLMVRAQGLPTWAQGLMAQAQGPGTSPWGPAPARRPTGVKPTGRSAR